MRHASLQNLFIKNESSARLSPIRIRCSGSPRTRQIQSESPRFEFGGPPEVRRIRQDAQSHHSHNLGKFTNLRIFEDFCDFSWISALRPCWPTHSRWDASTNGQCEARRRQGTCLRPPGGPQDPAGCPESPGYQFEFLYFLVSLMILVIFS